MPLPSFQETIDCLRDLRDIKLCTKKVLAELKEKAKGMETSDEEDGLMLVLRDIEVVCCRLMEDGRYEACPEGSMQARVNFFREKLQLGQKALKNLKEMGF